MSRLTRKMSCKIKEKNSMSFERNCGKQSWYVFWDFYARLWQKIVQPACKLKTFHTQLLVTGKLEKPLQPAGLIDMPRQYSRISSNDVKANVGSPPEPSLYHKSPSTTSVVSTTSVASTSDPTVKSIGQRISDKIHARKSMAFVLNHINRQL